VTGRKILRLVDNAAVDAYAAFRKTDQRLKDDHKNRTPTRYLNLAGKTLRIISDFWVEVSGPIAFLWIYLIVGENYPVTDATLFRGVLYGIVSYAALQTFFFLCGSLSIAGFFVKALFDGWRDFDAQDDRVRNIRLLPSRDQA